MTGEDYEAAKPVPMRSGVTGDPWVRGHLPECDVLHIADDDDGAFCICDRLRACEQRKDAEWASFVKLDEERNIAYAAGVQAARDAVAALIDVPRPMPLRDALTAIDALRGDA